MFAVVFDVLMYFVYFHVLYAFCAIVFF